MNRVSSCLASAVLATCFGVFSVALTGCGMGSSAGPQTVAVSVKGTVHGGQPGVSGSHVALFVTDSSGTAPGGYGGSVKQLAHATTDQFGSFTIATTYTCPANQYAYLVATGGNPGLTAGTDNSAIFLVAALGACDVPTLSNDGVDINEVTTVAAAYTLSGFFPAGGAGMTEAAVAGLADGSTMPGATTSSTNVQGLGDAFANAANIVNFNTGLAYTVTPSNANGVVPQGVIHLLADILQACVNAATPADTNCTAASPMGVLTAATPPGSSTTPANVFQAALNIAQYPANNVAALYAKKSSSPAFATTLTGAPTDWTVAVVYTNTTLVSASAIGISANDTVYVGGTGYLIDFAGNGAPINTTNLLTSFPSGDAVRYMEFDSSGHLFFADGNAASTDTKIYELNGSTTSVLNYGTVSTNANTYNLAIDKLGDVWVQNYSKATCASVTCNLIEFPNASGTYAPYNTFSTFTVPQPTGAFGSSRGIAFDVNTGNIWLTAIDDNLGELFKVTPVSGAVATAAAGAIQITGLGTEVASPSTKNGCGTISVAVDKNAAAWFLTSGGTSGNCGATTAAALSKVAGNITATTAGTAVDVSAAGLSAPTQLVIDGNNNIFIANQAASSIVEYNTTIGAPESGTLGFVPSPVDSAHTMYQPQYLEVDRAGALWTESTGNGSSHPANLIQILGVAAPSNPVQSAGQYGVKP